MIELKYVKLKDGTWKAFDKNGNYVIGSSKQQAGNMYFIKYGDKSFDVPSFDLHDYIGGNNDIFR